jgi:uncharacterized protein YjbI with pentapeptide repeats
VAVTVLSVVVVAACGSGKSGDSLSAGQIADGVAADIAYVSGVVYIDEDNDPNSLIGRPKGYVSAAVLQDTRYFKAGDELGVANGVTIEVFSEEKVAIERADRLRQFGQYAEIKGSVLLRADTSMKPSEFDEYKTVFLKFIDAGREDAPRFKSGVVNEGTVPQIVINGYLVGPGANLKDADLSNQNLDGLDLTGADLTNADLTLSSMRGTNFSSAIAVGANFGASVLEGAKFIKADLRNASFGLEMKPGSKKLVKASIDNADFTEANLAGAEFDAANMSNVRLVRVNAVGTDFVGVRMRSSDLSDGNFTRAVFSCCAVPPASTIPGIIEDFKFLVADLTGSNLTGANLTGAVLKNVTMPDGSIHP